MSNTQYSHNWLTNYADLVLELPKPGIEYRFYDLVEKSDGYEGVRDDLPEEFSYERSRLKRAGAIKALRKESTWPENTTYTIYETTRKAYNMAKFQREHSETFPCGHRSGFQTIDADEGVYACGYEYCDETFDRKTVEKVMR